MKRLRHWLAHRTGWNEGGIESRQDGEHVILWFRCAGCGKISNVHTAPEWLILVRGTDER